MSLKEITKDLHEIAEKTKFAQLLLSGEISVEQYATYLHQIIPVYSLIESSCRDQGFFKNLPGLERTTLVYQDYFELTGNDFNISLLPGTVEYCKYLLDLNSDPDKRSSIKAHLYCRHMGDLYGGQMIKRRVPGSGNFYKFENPADLKMKIREELTDDLGEEARVAFEWAIRMMKELCSE